MGKDQVKDSHEKNSSVADEKYGFDRKSYRLKKYSKKYKLDQWEKQRHQKLFRNYYKEINCDPLSGKFQKQSFDSSSADNCISVEKDANDENIEIEGHIPGQCVLLPEKLAERQVNMKKCKYMENQGTKSSQHRKFDAYTLAKQEYKRIQEEKKSKQVMKEKAKGERKDALDKYNKKKAERFKKLSQKTKKGQPVMKGRLELLFEKIQKTL